ncbi:adhesion G-protein coupled receptor G7 [Trichomycterus rosablanca]|uniref:adhesion G-protein coupled receptor G7 n=1 Tax=Trichomycterus rosablanca TaxID=2290929 RepID=UPI002F351F75
MVNFTATNNCLPRSVNNFTFPETITGQAGYSNEICSQGTENAGFPRATAFCVNGTFFLPKLLDCDLTLDQIYGNLSTSSAKHDLAYNTQILTSRPVQLTTQNISSAARISAYLLSLTETSQDIKVAALTTVSQLLNASRKQFSNTTHDSITSLTKNLTNFSLNQSDIEPLVQPNIAIYSIKVAETSGVKMTVFADSERDTFSPNRIKLNYNNSPSDNISVDVNINLNFKKDSSGNTQNEDADIGIVLYNNDRFFMSKVFKVYSDTNRKVISGKLRKENTLESVQFTMSSEKSSSKHVHEFACVIWNYTQQDWSTEGCKKSEKFTCECNGTPDLANFAMLMSYSSSYEYSLALSLISKIGCALSVAGLTITAVFQILTRKSRKANSTILMVSICTCLTIVYFLFIFGINNSLHQSNSLNLSDENDIPDSEFYVKPDNGLCTAVAVLLHYFLLATFTWSTLYGTYIFLSIKNALAGSPRGFRVFSIVAGWGLPAVVAGITLGVTYRIDEPLNYRREEFCWLATVDHNNHFDARKPMLWGFLLPIATMIIFNIATFFYFALTTCRTNPALNSSNVPSLQKKMIICISMSVLLGLSWISGYFMLMSTNPIMSNILSFIFCLCSSTQGIQIFVFFTLRTSVFKKKARALLKLIPAPVFSLHRKSFDLWATNESRSQENDRFVNFDLCEMPVQN